MKKLARIAFVLSACALLADPLFAALAPVESRSSQGNSNRSQGSTISDPIPPTPVFTGTNQTVSASSGSASASTSARNSKNTHPPVASGSGYPMTSQDRAAHLTLSQIENLQREVSELRGLVETQDHTIKQLKKSQQDLYLDLERRLNQLQNAGQRATAATSTTKAATSSSNAATIGAQPAVKSAKPAGAPAVAGAKTAATGLKTAPGKSTVSVNANANAHTNASIHDNADDDVDELENSNDKVALSKSSQTTNSGNIALMGEKETYQNAYGFVRSKKYDEAIEGLQDYLNRFQKGEQAPHAHYWLGEVYMVQWHNDKSNHGLLEKATHEFINITREYPNHPKTADALLKLGLIEIDKGNPDKAQQYLSQVKSRYPGSAAARIAENRLQQLPAD